MPERGGFEGSLCESRRPPEAAAPCPPSAERAVAARAPQPSVIARLGWAVLSVALVNLASVAFGQSDQESITVTEDVRAAYRYFREAREPLFFALSTDGQGFGLTFCPTPRPCRRATARANALRLCERNSGGTPCQVYADDRRIVWTGPPVIGLSEGSAESPKN
ncbi:MAG: hypothetical protein QNI93_14420 [Kiloniellales bacterium]|nr:hypothetical protein [Kiloniellales bacterium]MDJ0982583.1 hypothetical protein [Kiloniellales bacterium]